jgi:hypothetical protein
VGERGRSESKSVCKKRNGKMMCVCMRMFMCVCECVNETEKGLSGVHVSVWGCRWVCLCVCLGRECLVEKGIRGQSIMGQKKSPSNYKGF